MPHKKKSYSNEYDKHLNWEDRIKARVSRFVRGKTEGPVRGLEMDKETGAITHKAPESWWKTEAGKHATALMKGPYISPGEKPDFGIPKDFPESYKMLKKKKKKKEKEEAKEKKRKEKFKKKFEDK